MNISIYESTQWRFVQLEEEFKAGRDYRFLVTYDIWHARGKIKNVEHILEYIRLDTEKKVSTGTMNAGPQLSPNKQGGREAMNCAPHHYH
jgi:hypothetical protein